MDIMLERMLSLIPRKEDGKYVHGEKKKFCEKIGAPTNIISEWENGKTKSYRNYVLAVAQAYSVSPKWISGEIDEKWPSTEAGERPTNEYEAKILNAVRSVPVEYQDVLLNMILSVAQTLKESPGLPLSDLLRQE